ncbi:XRE family transcriptional regulator [Sinorhizobium meliloti]|uniref:helix-turn-helix domain-containing protein n=1 Tax=Rhizobium meliloti TaxID=382 RepID=UPI000FD6EE85|nr:XRE family transcriptional regulator [Sinorhizobium meliloti]RVG23093.1 XRE family transcriptional regulator [Sinorhizobium meliloti]RVL00707.1 XRE family transcriptional regulator [Sinorhizobium meliloti]RVN46442.1 XRE family transcriptional regulator [Sinorhizobium meliloti]
MTNVEAVNDDNYPPIGLTVQILRKRQKLTLNDLAQKSGLSISAVSKIENAQVSPTYETILRLAVGLNVDVTELFGGSSTPTSAAGRITVTRKGTGIVQKTPHYEYEMLAAELSKKEFTPLLTKIRARSIQEFAEMQGHTGEEFFFVLSGQVALHTEHYEPILLSPGDSSYFDSAMGHALISVGEEDATVLWVATRVHGVLARCEQQPV